MSELVRYKENILLDILQCNVNHVFVETPVSFYYPIQEYMNRLPYDTTADKFELFSGNKATEVSLRYVYTKNLFIEGTSKYKFFPIDMVYPDAINIENIIWLFKKKIKPNPIKNGYKYLKQIKNDSIKYKNEDTLIHQYLKYKENFYSNLPVYKSYLKKNYNEMKKIVDGIFAYSIARKEDTICDGCLSNSREVFMLNNIMLQTKEDSIKKFISINGAFHVFLNIQDSLQHKKMGIVSGKV